MKKVYKILNLDCAMCAATIEEEIGKISGVKSARVNFVTQKLSIDAEEADFDGIMADCVKICKRVEPDCKIVL